MFPETKPIIDFTAMYMCKHLVLIKGCDSIKRKCFLALGLLDVKCGPLLELSQSLFWGNL